MCDTETPLLKQHLDRLKIPVAQVASFLGLHRVSVYGKLSGRNPWKVHEALAVTDYLRQWDPSLTVESLFGDTQPPAATDKAAA